MTREQAAAHIAAINACARYVPPDVFRDLAQSMATSELVMIAQGSVICTLEQPPKPKPKESNESGNSGAAT